MKRLPWYTFLFVLVFSPLAFGTVEAWSVGIMEISIFVALLVLLSNRRYIYFPPGFILLLVFLSYLVIQIIPLPAVVIRVLSPSLYEFYRNSLMDMDGSWLSLSIQRKETLKEVFRFSSYAGFYLLSVNLLDSQKRVRKLLSFLSVFFFLLSIEAILQSLIGNGRLLWIRTPPSSSSPFGPYVNRNHYAGLMEMVLPVVFSYFILQRPSIRYGSLKDRLVEFMTQKRANMHMQLGFFCIVMATSIFLSLSRGGIISVSLSMILLGVLFFNEQGQRRLASFVIVFFIVIVFSVGWFGWEPIVERFERLRPQSGTVEELRLTIWSDSFGIIRDYLLTGTGAGTYLFAYPAVRSFFSDRIVDHAHNDYIELLTDIGLTGTILFCFFVITVIYRSLRKAASRRDRMSRLLTAGAFAGTVAILIHSITDFNLHIGANGLYFFFLLSLLVSFSHTRFQNQSTISGSYLRPLEVNRRVFIPVPAFLLGVIVLFNTGVFAAKAKMGRFLAGAEVVVREDDAPAALRAALSAASLDPLEPLYYHIVARIYEEEQQLDRAFRYYLRSLEVSPFSSHYLVDLGGLLARVQRDDLAERILNQALEVDRSNPEVYLTLAGYYFRKKRIEEGVMTVRRAIMFAPRETKKFITLMLLNGLEEEEIAEAIPESFIACMEYADYLIETGNTDMADKIINLSLELADANNSRPYQFLKIYNYYYHRRRYNDALRVVLKAIRLFPENASLHLTAARLYERMGIRYRAVEEYRKVLLVDPRNRIASKALGRLVEQVP